MKRRLVFIVILLSISSVLMIIGYNNYIYSNNSIGMIFSSNMLSKSEKAWLEDKEYLIYSSDHATPPLRFVDESTDRYIGMVIDYIEALSLELGVEIKLKPDIWQNALDNLKDGKVDMVDMYPSEVRSEFYNFTNTIFYQNGIMLVPNGSNIHSVSDLSELKVAAQTGDFVNGFIEEEVPSAIIVNTDDYSQAVELLKDGKVDAVVGDETVIYHFMKFYEMTDSFHIGEELLYENRFVLGIPKSEPELVSILNKTIKSLNRKNILTSIQQKWFGISTPISNQESIGKYIIPGIFILIVIFASGYIFYSWNKSLKANIEEALNSTELALQTTFDGLNHLMIVLDHNKIIVNGNHAFFSKLGLSKNEVIGKSIFEFFEEDLFDLHEIVIDFVIYEVGIHIIDSSSQSYIIMLEDVTDTKIHEQQILNDNKMAAIGQLAAGVAHEIRNPLGLIRNHTYLLKHDPEEPEKSYEVIEKSVERASRIIDNLLNFSSLSGDEVVAFDFKGFLNNIVDLYRDILIKQKVGIEIECPSIVVKMNQEALKHIMSNLISNAVDAIGKEGLITIECYKEEESLVIVFSDNGPGVDDDVLLQLFNPFFTTKATGKGTGLGLYIVYTEIEKLNGRIKADHNGNQGLKFKITLPLERG